MTQTNCQRDTSTGSIADTFIVICLLTLAFPSSCYDLQDSDLGTMGTYGVCDVASRTQSSDKPKRAGEVVETDAPRTMSSYCTEHRAKQATSTASIGDAYGDKT